MTGRIFMLAQIIFYKKLILKEEVDFPVRKPGRQRLSKWSE